MFLVSSQNYTENLKKNLYEMHALLFIVRYKHFVKS